MKIAALLNRVRHKRTKILTDLLIRKSNAEPECLREPRRVYPRIELFYWSPKGGDENFGDHISKVIVTKLLADEGFFIEEGSKRYERLLAVGSILHFARDGDHVWGSGINGKMRVESHTFRSLNVHAVRGPKTRDFLLERGIDVPEVFGDPALLLPNLLPNRFIPNATVPVVVVPNLHDLEATSNLPNVVSPFLPWNECVQRITRAEFVAASSLHGLVIAEAYGIPARYVRFTETEGLFKYEDYVLGTGRSRLEYARSLEEAIEMGGMPPISFDSAKLIKAFPLYLWRDNV
jgi:pyruvyltransferase